MRSLLLHANKFQTEVIEESTMPQGIIPEKKKSLVEKMEKCLVCFFTVEKNDNQEEIDKFYLEIIKTSREIGTKNLMISPFVHLSNNIASSIDSKAFYMKLVNKFKNTDYVVQTSHFGYHKSLVLDIKGHPGSFRFREF